MIGRRRPFAALHIAIMCLLGSRDQDAVTPELLLAVIRTLTAAARGDVQTSEKPRLDSSLGYDLCQLLNVVEKAQVVDETELAQIEWTWLPVLEHTERGPVTLYRLLAREPAMFAQVVGFIYRPRHEGQEEETVPLPDELTRARGTQAFQLLHEWRGMPGRGMNNSVNEEQLRNWVFSARQAFATSGHQVVGDHLIGEVLARSPQGTDGCWPHEAVRRLINDLHSETIEEGMVLGVLNGRGPTWRSLDTGGEPERELAIRYAGWATVLAGSYPRTTKVLQDIRQHYQRNGSWHDHQRNLNEYT